MSAFYYFFTDDRQIEWDHGDLSGKHEQVCTVRNKRFMIVPARVLHMYPENRYRQKGGLKFLPSFKIQHNKYSKIVMWAEPR